MDSVNSVLNLIAEAKGIILILMQEGDSIEGFSPHEEWADQMYRGWELLGEAEREIGRAEDIA